MTLSLQEQGQFISILDKEEEQVIPRRTNSLRVITESSSDSNRFALDEEDMAESCGQLAVSIGLLKSSEETLKKIEAARERINKGTFGQCGDCGNDIPWPRLLAVPYETKCVRCKEREEQERAEAQAIKRRLPFLSRFDDDEEVSSRLNFKPLTIFS